MKTQLFIKIFFGISILFITERAFSMAPPPPPPPAAGGPVVPIDGGIGLLLAAGVGYGAKKYYDLKKKTKDNTME